MSYNKLPADPTAMILGIIALVLSIVGCCCGFLAFVPLTLSIIGLVMANKSLREFNLNPDIYDPQSKSNVSTSKILNIIALIMSSITILVYLAYFLIYGALFSAALMEGYKSTKNSEEFQYEWDNDSIRDSNYSDDYYEMERDTIQVDSINIEELIETEIDSLNN